MNLQKCGVLAVIAGLLFTWQALGQSALTPEQQAAASRSLATKGTDTAVTDTLPALFDGVSIEAGQANNKATLNLSRKIGNQSLTGTLSTPLDKSSQSAALASLEGLAADFDASISYTGFFFPTKGAAQDVFAKQHALCKEYGAAENECDNIGIERAIALDCGFPASLGKVEESKVQEVIKEFATSHQVTSKQESCLDSRRGRAEERFNAASLGLVNSVAFTGDIGRKTANFFQTDGAKGSQSNLPYAVSAAYGLIGNTSRYSLRGRYETRYDDGKTVSRCQPVSGADSESGLTSCTQLPFGAPTRSRAFLLTGEGRWFFLKFATSLIAAYDFKKDILGLQLPIYLVRNSDGQLTGGFRLGWRNDTHLTASVFISKPLSVGD